MSPWTTDLELHLDALRANLFERRVYWPIIAKRTGLALRTIRSIAYNTAHYRNPRLSTLVSIAEALATLERTPRSFTTR